MTSFDTYVILNETVDLTGLSSNVEVELSLYSVKGFSVTKQASPIFSLAANYITLYVVLTNSFFHMWDRRGRLLGESCDEYSKSYYDLSNEEFERHPNKTRLAEEFGGLFSFNIYVFEFTETVAHNRKLCPLIFKGARIYRMKIGLSQTIRLIYNTMKFQLNILL